MRINKKGQTFFTDPIVDYFSVLVFIAVVILFVYVAKNDMNRANTYINSTSATLDSSTVLLDLLRTPVVFKGEKTTVANLAVDAYYDADARTMLKAQTQSIMDGFIAQSGYGYYSVTYNYPPPTTQRAYEATPAINKPLAVGTNLNQIPGPLAVTKVLPLDRTRSFDVQLELGK